MSQSMSIPASQTRRPATMSAGMSDRWFSILLITPAMVVILVFALLPLAYALDVSFRFADLTRGRLGDFVGLDDPMNEHPRVVRGFIDVFNTWVDRGVDGFRIDTMRHVNTAFWQA